MQEQSDAEVNAIYNVPTHSSEEEEQAQGAPVVTAMAEVEPEETIIPHTLLRPKKTPQSQSPPPPTKPAPKAPGRGNYEEEVVRMVKTYLLRHPDGAHPADIARELELDRRVVDGIIHHALLARGVAERVHPTSLRVRLKPPKAIRAMKTRFHIALDVTHITNLQDQEIVQFMSILNATILRFKLRLVGRVTVFIVVPAVFALHYRSHLFQEVVDQYAYVPCRIDNTHCDEQDALAYATLCLARLDLYQNHLVLFSKQTALQRIACDVCGQNEALVTLVQDLSQLIHVLDDVLSKELLSCTQ